MDINDLLTGFEGTDYDDDRNFVNTAAQVQIPDGAGFIAYYYLNNAWDATIRPRTSTATGLVTASASGAGRSRLAPAATIAQPGSM